MRILRCPNCHKELIVANDVVSVLCGCGYYYEENSAYSKNIASTLKKIQDGFNFLKKENKS